MLARAASLRLWLLVAMIVSAIVGLGGAALLDHDVESSHERAGDVAKAHAQAEAIAGLVAAGAGPTRLADVQRVLVDDRLTITRRGVVVFRGPPPPGRHLELRVRVPTPDGDVELADYSTPRPGANTTLDLVLITAGVLGLVIAAAILTATQVTRAVRGPLGRAIAAAERLSRGDLSARMGSTGPAELVRLGHAFDSMAQRLQRADLDQRQFLADVAHEIATPVNTISGFGLALADGTVRGEAGRAEAGAFIRSETERLHGLLTDLRELTRLDLAEGVHPGPVQLEALARDLEARFGPAAEAAGLSLALDVRAGRVHSDRRLLETIASNLLSNAIRYTPRGGRVALSLRAHRDRLVLTVRDTGIGIAPEHRDRVFERLYRVDGARDRGSGGSGLGLALAQRAAESLGGHIELRSRPGEGSEFRVVLPVTRARRPASGGSPR